MSLNAYVRATHNAEILEQKRLSTTTSGVVVASAPAAATATTTTGGGGGGGALTTTRTTTGQSLPQLVAQHNSPLSSLNLVSSQQQQTGSWLSRILNNDDFQSSPMSLELPVRRSFTPLRPSASAMTQRVNASLSQQQQQQQQQRSILYTSGVSNYNNNNIYNNGDFATSSSAQLSPLKQLSEPMDATGAVNKVSPATSQRSFARDQSEQKSQREHQQQYYQNSQNKQNLASPLREISRVAAAAPVVHERPPSSNDPFVEHEDAVMKEIRLLRRNPMEYAKIVETDLLLTRPFLPATHKRLNLAGMKAFVDDRTRQLADLTQQLEQLDEKHKAEVQALKDQWFADDNDRTKKRKNPAAQPGMKKADAEKALQQMLAEQDDQRREAIDSMDRATEDLRRDLQVKMAIVNVELAEAKDGVDWLTKLISRLLTTRALIPAESNRGLSIAARTIADESGGGGGGGARLISSTTTTSTSAIASSNRSYANLSGSLVGLEKELPEICSRYGQPSGGYLGVAALIGPARSPRETVFEMLLSLADRKFRRSRHALLDPRSAMLGCAWRKKVGDPVVGCNTVTVVVTASHFSELSAISDRSHLNVDVLRREVTAACSVMDANSYDAYTQQPPEIGDCPTADRLSTTVLRVTREIPEDPQGSLVASEVEIVSPTAQPAPCGNDATILLRCGPNAAVCAAVLSEANSSPSASSSRQRSLIGAGSGSGGGGGASSRSGISRVPATMSSAPQFAPGEQLVQRDPDTGLISIRVKLPSAGLHNVAVFLRDGSDVFRRIAVVAFDSTRSFDPREAWRRYPILSSDFADRNGYLIAPLDGVIAPDSEVVFKVSLPISAHYKGRERQRIANLIAEAKQQDENSKASIERVQARLEEAKAKYEEAVATRDASIAQINGEVTALQKDLQKRKSGKEHDRLKSLVADADARVASIHGAISKKKTVCENLGEELQGYHKTRQQTSAMLVRYAEEQKILDKCTDRSKPLLVELATDERRATLAPADDGSEVYSARIRTPGVGGHVSMFVGGALAILFDVLPPPPHYFLTNHAELHL